LFDILVYLFESYIHTDAFPETDLLTRKLSAAGFDQEDISEALDWLAGLRRVSRDIHPGLAPSAGSVRIYTDEEQAQLDPRCRGFLSLLESAGVLSAAHRELIIERAMALDDFTITLNRLKVIVLMVLWQQDEQIDMLMVDELLTEEDDWAYEPTLH
jgi:Smg protein